jgi:hypothetical protein
MDRYQEGGANFTLEGKAKERGMRNLCKKKLCAISADRQFLFDMMFEMSRANDCFEVKIRKEDRNGVFFGHCYFTNESSLGDAWAKYESHPKTWVVIQDDEFSDLFRKNIRTY